MLRKEWVIVGAKGASLFVREWTPVTGKPKAVVCLIHGMGEHGDRYGHVAARFAEAGIAVIAHDQHGHGRSSGKRGHLHSLGAAASDAGLVMESAAERHLGLPIFLYGHSMGGNVAINCALRLRPGIQGLILTSPWLQLAFKPHAAVEWLGRRLAAVLPALQQSTGLNPADLFRPGYEHAAAIVGDPLCHTRITLHTFKEISDGGEWALANASSLHVPMLLLHGTSDRVTSIGASEQLAGVLGDVCSFRRWDGGYHELHNDLEGERAISELIFWIEQQL